MRERVAVVGTPFVIDAPKEAGAEIRPCFACQAPLVISRASQAIIAQGADLYCMVCLCRVAGVVEFLGMSPEGAAQAERGEWPFV